MDVERWEATLDRILELTVLLGQDMAEYLAREGLTESRAHLLWQLRQRGPCTQATLAADLHVTPRTITALVDGLAATGFVTREPHPSDRRAALVTFTERGRATAEALLDGHRRLARQLFAGLPDDAFNGLDAGLLHVIARFRGVLAEKKPAMTNRADRGHPSADRTGGGGSRTGPSPAAGPGKIELSCALCTRKTAPKGTR